MFILSLFLSSKKQDCLKCQDTEFYAKLGELKKWRFLLEKSRDSIRETSTSCQVLQDSLWTLNHKTVVEKGRCSDGKSVEVKHTYNEAVFRSDQSKVFDFNFQSLHKTISSDFSCHSFMSQLTEKQVHLLIKAVLDLPSILENGESNPNKTHEFKSLISCIFAFIRTEDQSSDHFKSCQEWLTQLIGILLRESSDLDDRLFILNHVLRCTSGIEKWSTGYIQCPSPLDSPDFDSAVNCMNYCLVMLQTILSPIKARDKFLGISDTVSPVRHAVTIQSNSNSSSTPSPQPATAATDEAWLLVDPETDQSADVFANSVNFTEKDIIDLLKQIPFVGVIKFITKGSGHDYCTFGEVSEVALLKLLSVSTRIVQILRQGLITFNCIQFKALTEYITLLIKTTVMEVSSFWSKIQQNLRSEDEALLTRLQVEYDHFILRTTQTILECQRFGSWKFISVIPFNGVTGAMMWHILWVVYNNGRNDDQTKIYESDEYWRDKFVDALKSSFAEKLPSLSTSESHCLLESLGNMVKSRNSNQINFISTVTNEMFELSFIIPQKNDKMAKKCIDIFAEIARIHPKFLSALIKKIKESNPRNESIIECLESIPCESWKPSKDDMDILSFWLIHSPFNHFCNRLARVIVTKINWGYDRQDSKRLHLHWSYHRNMAVELYNAAKMHVYVDGSEDPFNTSSFSGFDGKATLTLAKSSKPKDLIEWSWRLLLSLKLHLFEQPCINSEKAAASNTPCPEENESQVNEFINIPDVNVDTALLPISKGLLTQNPFAVYITLSMTETGHRPEMSSSNVDLLVQLMNGKNFVQSLSILSWFIPLNIDSLETVMLQNGKFIAAFNALLVSGDNEMPDRILGLIRRQLENHSETKVKILSFWTDLLHEVATLVVKVWSKSWFLASNKGLVQVVYLLDNLVQLTHHDDCLHSTLLESLMMRPFDAHFAKQMSSAGLFSWIPFNSNNPLKKCEWISPMHVLQQKFPDKTWFSWIIVKGDVVKMNDIWHEILLELNSNFELTPDIVVKNVCGSRQLTPIPSTILPINAFGELVLNTQMDHPLLPVITFGFFRCFFSSTSEGSLGYRFLSDVMMKALKIKMSQMADYHHKQWSVSHEPLLVNHHSDNTKLYRAFSLWLEEQHLHDAFVDCTQLPAHFCVDILKAAMEGANESVIMNYVDHSKSFEREEHLLKLWLDVKEYDANVYPLVLNFSHFALLTEDVIKPCPVMSSSSNDTLFSSPDDPSVLEGAGPAVSCLLQHNIQSIMEEERFFARRLTVLSDLNRQFLQLIPEKYRIVSKETVAKGSCVEDCSGPALIILSFKEATENCPVVREIERNRIEYNKVLIELMETPSDKCVISVILTQRYMHVLKRSSQEEDRQVFHHLHHYLIKAIQANGRLVFPPAKHLFDSITEQPEGNPETRLVNGHFFIPKE